MKKILLIAVCMVFAITADAQFYVGGTLNFSTTNTKISHADETTTTTFGIDPEVGYNISKKFAVAMELGYGHSKVEDESAINTFYFGPYLRYTFAQLGNSVRLFAEGSFHYGTADYGYYDTDLWTVGVRPGILVNLSSKFCFVGRMELFSYGSTTDDNKVEVTAFAIDPTNVQLGIQYNF